MRLSRLQSDFSMPHPHGANNESLVDAAMEPRDVA